MTRKEREKAINALKTSVPIRVMTQEEFLNIPKDYPTDKPVIKEDASGYFEKEVYEAVKPYMDEYLYY